MANCFRVGIVMLKQMKILTTDFNKICAQSREEYLTGECCGLLTWVPTKSTVNVHLCVNLQNTMHRRDPERFPRTNLNAYLIDPGEQLAIISEAEKNGGGLAGFYHSHVDCDAYFSQEDKDQACALFGDEPTYPDAVYLVVSVYGSRSSNSEPSIHGHKCFAWDGDALDFIEVPLKLV